MGQTRREVLLRELDARLAATDALLAARYPGPATGRRPVHTVYVPAALLGPVRERVVAKLAREPVEDLRVDFEDGYGCRADAEEDAAAGAAGAVLGATRGSVAFAEQRSDHPVAEHAKAVMPDEVEV